MSPLRWCARPLIVSAIVTIGLGCTHGPTAPPPTPVAENKDGNLQYIVTDGESAQAVFSADGDRILFVSKKRSHARDQVYEKDLKSGVERRITYQNGNTYQPRYMAKPGWIVYSSSTDELEENPALLQAPPGFSKLPYPYQEQMEIYKHSLHSLEITRLTEHPGFDGEARFMPDGNLLTFTRVANQKTKVMTLNWQNRTARELQGLGSNPTQYTSSPDGKSHAWIEWDESFGVSRLLLQNGKSKPIEIASEAIVVKSDLSFSPDSQWLFWAQKSADGATYDLWSLRIGATDLCRLTTTTEGERRDPTLSPDQRWLMFTVRSRGWSRIARQGFVLSAGPCPKLP